MISYRSPVFAALLLFVAAGCVTIDPTVPVAMQPPLKSRKMQSLDEMLALDSADIDIGAAALAISRGERKDLDIAGYLGKIDGLAARLERRLGPRADIDDVVAAMNNAMLKGRSDRGKGFDRFDVARALDGKSGNCLAASVLYLAVGQRLGLPVEGVTAPGHYFVRFHGPRKKVNVELTRWGAVFSDNYYRHWLRIDSDAVRKGIYLRGDDTKDVIAVLLANRSAVRSASGRFAPAVDDARKALKLRPGYPQASVNLGRALEGLAKPADAAKHYEAALAVDPHSTDALNNLAFVLSRRGGDSASYRAQDLIEKAIRLRPERAVYRHSAAKIYDAVGRLDKAIHHMSHAVRLEPRNALYAKDLERYRTRLLSGTPAVER